MLVAIKPFVAKEIFGSFQSIEFDGLLNVTPTYSSIVTQRPTEDNETISDAIHNRPIKLKVDIIITENAQSIIDWRAITNLPNITGIKIGTSFIGKQIDKLKKIRADKIPVNIETKYSIYSNYFIESFTIRETEDEAIIISFEMIQGKSEVLESESLGAKINRFIAGVFS